MDKAVAQRLADQHLQSLRPLEYAALKRRADAGLPETAQVTDENGREYQLEIQYLIDDPRTDDVRVMVAIDDGGWRAFAPLCRDFVMSPDGRFLGE